MEDERYLRFQLQHTSIYKCQKYRSPFEATTAFGVTLRVIINKTTPFRLRATLAFHSHTNLHNITIFFLIPENPGW
ncbi:hypothetical protein MTR_8g021320 [Medicago truncatula]|uniref:Uncharacterized protein n=1 Tax=Medicago truncatula TaxID=3880 RepID=A0A072TNT4_MEDTR|nr:hypothetical protein MTR_8g021320 [Medicago truncatula]